MFSLASMILASTVGTLARDLPENLTGGIYDRPVIIRPGIDDIGMSFGRFAACTRKTVNRAVEQGLRPPLHKEIQIEVVQNSATLTIPGNDENLEFVFSITRQVAYLKQIVMGRETFSDFKSKFSVLALIVEGCRNR